MTSEHIYLDWNVFNKIEHITSLKGEELIDYAFIRQAIKDEKIITLYSNAHMSDLSRGYRKNPDFINGHLDIIEELTQNLCITQYWGNKQSTWHYRSPHEYFYTALDDNGFLPDSFAELLPTYDGEDGLPERLVNSANGLTTSLIQLYEAMPLPEGFSEIYKANPIFHVMFPRCKTEKNMLSMLDDLYAFSRILNTDYTIYKSLKKYINQARMRMIKNQEIFKQVDNSTSETPKQFLLDDSWEKYMPESKGSENKAYNKIMDEYFKLDMKGFKSDSQFPNMIDDSLHTFYGAHCTIFVSTDDKCRYKASEVYKKLKIQTLVMSPNEFREHLISKETT